MKFSLRLIALIFVFLIGFSNVVIGQSIPSADRLLADGQAASNPYVAMEIFQEGLLLYPNDNRFRQGIETSANTIMRWSRNSHSRGSFPAAINGYTFIIETPNIHSRIKDQARILRDFAMANRQIYSADQLVERARGLGPYDAMEIFQEGFLLYPEDNRFRQGIEASANTIMRWSRSSHTRGSFPAAINGYTFLINTPNIPLNLREEAQRLREHAMTNRRLFTANQLAERARGLGPYEAMEIFQEGFLLYPTDNRFRQGIEDSANTIMRWSRSSHSRGSFPAAINGYTFIIETPNISSSLREEAQRLREHAMTNRRLFTANQLVERARGLGPYDAMEIFQEGFLLYPTDNRFRQGIDDSANTIMRWSRNSHSRGSFPAAINGYTFIIETPNIHSSLRAEAQRFRQHAMANRILYSEDQLINMGQALENTRIFQAMDFYQEGLVLYPSDERFRRAIHRLSQTIFDQGRAEHNRGKFYQAIDIYERLLSLPNIHSSVRQRTQQALNEAKGSIIIVNDRFHVMFTYYPITFEEFLNIQMSRNPQTDLYGGGWRSALREDVRFHLDPENFIMRDFSNIQPVPKVRVNTQTLRVRTGPSTSHEQIGQVTRGQTFEFLRRENGWYQIPFNGGTGWISGDHVIEFVEEFPEAMFQFLVLSGRSGVTASDLNVILRDRGSLHNMGQAFIEAGRRHNINEIYLVSHAILETGNGRSSLATGVLVTEVDGRPVEPRVVYNMFGIGALDRAPLRLGSEYAYTQGWFTPEQAIIEGAHWISVRYVNNPTHLQDTLYKMRWNPQSPGRHQYATDIGWALKQTSRIRQLYDQCENFVLRFDIPVFLR